MDGSVLPVVHLPLSNLLPEDVNKLSSSGLQHLIVFLDYQRPLIVLLSCSPVVVYLLLNILYRY